MVVRHRRQRRDGDDRGLGEMRQIAHQLLDELCDELAWKRDMAYGNVVRESAGVVSGGGDNDPTMLDAASRQGLRSKVARGMRDLRWLIDRKLPEMLGRLELQDERPRESDDDPDRPGGPVSVWTGVSAYRGDTRAPAGRPDLAEALDAQHRRIGRGQAFGTG